MLLIFTKIYNLINYIIFFFLLKKLSLKKYGIKKNTLLLIRLDSIGDYILIRNFFCLIKESEKYKNFKTTLCGNILWKELAETLDSDCINEFIWLDRSKFKKNISYKYNFLKKIREKEFEEVIDLTYSREILFGDTIVKASTAVNKTGSTGSLDSYVKWKRKLFSDKYYTRLIPASTGNIFEFYRNKDFFEQLLGTSLNIKSTSIDASKITFDTPGDKYAVLFPGANEEKRRWDINYFSEVARFLSEKYLVKIVIAGSSREAELAEKIALTSGINIIDKTGKTNLSQLAKLIKNAVILISNETSAVHFSAAVGTPFVCISNGNHFGRFHPYPKEIFDKAFYVYPPEIMNESDNLIMLAEKFRYNSDLDINEIKPEVVKKIIQELSGLQ